MDIFEELNTIRKGNPSNLICGYININSIRYKHDHIVDLLGRNLLDILFVSETKIDDSFPNAQFAIDGYSMWRADRNQYGGGVMAYLRSDIAGDRQPKYEFKNIESIGIEVRSEDTKWLFCGVYKVPSMKRF